MPVIGVPCINRPDLLRRFLESVDEPWPVVVIDNSGGPGIASAISELDVQRVAMPGNLGVAASWNLIIRTRPRDAWWCIANADAELTPGALAKLAAEMDQGGPRWVGMDGDWRVFGISAAAVAEVGLFDENFHPVYCEDADYERRCDLAGVPRYTIPTGTAHVGSAAIRSDPAFGAANGRTYPANVEYYRRKWGGSLRGGETFGSPFDRSVPISEWSLDFHRVRDQSWETTALEPAGWETR